MCEVCEGGSVMKEMCVCEGFVCALYIDSSGFVLSVP